MEKVKEKMTIKSDISTFARKIQNQSIALSFVIAVSLSLYTLLIFSLRHPLQKSLIITSTRHQGAPIGQDYKASLLPISQNTTPRDSLQVDHKTVPSFLYREAEHPDEILGEFKIEKDHEAFGGEYLVLPREDAIASYRFTVNEAQAGEYYLWGRVLSYPASGCFRVSFDANHPQYIWDTGVFQKWTWTIFVARQGKYAYYSRNSGNATPQRIHLTAGKHTLTIWHWEPDALLDALLLSRIIPTKSGEVIHVLPHQPLEEGWMNQNAKEWQLISPKSSEVFTSYIRFGVGPTPIWPLQRLRFSGQPLEVAFPVFSIYQTHLLSSSRPPKRRFLYPIAGLPLRAADYCMARFHGLSVHYRGRNVFCLSFGSRSEMFAVASPVVFLSNESGLLAVQGWVSALGEGFTPRQKRELRQMPLNGGWLILLANKQGLPPLRREIEKILKKYEWKALPRSHSLFLYPEALPESVSIKGMQLQASKEFKDEIGQNWRVLLVEIEDKKVVPQFLWNLNYFQEGKEGK